MSADPFDSFIAAVERSEVEALARHEAGTCGESEWSCSWCPGGLRSEVTV